MAQKTNEEIIDAFQVVLPYINDVLREDVIATLLDKQNIAGYDPAKHLDAKLTVGKPIAELHW